MKNMNRPKIGCAIFRPDLNNSTRKRLFTKQIVKTLSKDELWWLCLGIYKQNWKMVFQLMQETSVLKLQLGRNEDCKIMGSITGIYFSHLKALCFGKNKIANIEQIQNINAPNLEWLSFQENYITDLRSLRKAHFPRLKILNLKTNRLREIDLRQLNVPELIKVTTEFFHTDETQGQSLNWLFTLQSSNLLILRCRGDTRIKSSAIDSAVKKKYPLLNVKSFDVNNIDAEENSDSDHS